MDILIIGAVIFMVSVFVIEMSIYAFRIVRNPDRGQVRKRLRRASSTEHETEAPDILKHRLLSEVPLLNRILSHIPGIQRLDLFLIQANSKYPLGVFILFTIVILLSSFLASSIITGNHALSAGIAVLLCGIPFFYLRFKKRKRMEKFKSQLPEGLDLIARALKAGHAFTTGLQLAADEFDDPLGPEFDETLDEVNFGVSVADALKSLADRIDCPDLKYFVVSVIVQRETGGNLAEIIESLAHLIRERFKLQGKVRILSAEGRLSAIILMALPFLIILGLRIVNPEYINILFEEGRKMAIVAGILMILGVIAIKRMIKIKV